ncbi:hypothetical protein [Mesorhizobium sp. BE184]|uniref:hypothetical protein n=1 Tax=Mesorhizobium sp. BE184 TaxID=2817714 RepID=UPI0028563859|nr:hypothetical protein [Mesorhizobium sp. BE184]MDR7035247.1 hypothetical protein [Mesorhizobium sp. BE184]
MILTLLKRAAGFAENDLIPTEEFASEFDAFTIPAETTILDRSASVVSDFLSLARAEKDRLETEIASRQERLRHTIVAIEAFEPVLTKLDEGYDPADAKPYDVAIETKRRRGDKPFRKPVLAAAE